MDNQIYAKRTFNLKVLTGRVSFDGQSDNYSTTEAMMNKEIAGIVVIALLSACAAKPTSPVTSQPSQERLEATQSAKSGQRMLGRSTCDPSELAACIETIRSRVRAAMNYAGLDAVPPNAQVMVHVLLAPDGQVMQAKVAKSSGYKEFDTAVVAAIEKATPLPALPDPAERRFYITFQK